MTRRLVIMLLLVGVLFGGIFGYQAFKDSMIKKSMKARGVPKQIVSTITAGEQTWQPQFKAVGSLLAVQGADIAPELNGLVTRIHFTSGEEVKAGALLVELDAASDIAKLKSLKATAELARKTFVRDQQQFKDRAISQATLDTDAANLKIAEAQVAEQKALVDKKFIRAPFDGRLGIRAVDLGQYLEAGTKIVTLQALDPIYVDFYLPQKTISQISVNQHVSVSSDAFPGKAFTGAISAIDPEIDTGTRNVHVRATIKNTDRKLLPGMFVTTMIKVGQPQHIITLPQTAITYNPYGNVVFFVEEHRKGPEGKPVFVAKQKFVKTGETRGDQVAILEGVKEGDVVVTSGQIKLRSGTPIEINNSIEPSNEPAPEPRDE